MQVLEGNEEPGDEGPYNWDVASGQHLHGPRDCSLAKHPSGFNPDVLRVQPLPLAMSLCATLLHSLVVA